MKKVFLAAGLSASMLAVTACDPAEPADDTTSQGGDETEVADEGGDEGTPDYNVSVVSSSPLSVAEKEEATSRIAKEIEAETKDEDASSPMALIVYWDNERTSLTMRMVERMVQAGLVEVDGCWNFSHPLCP